MPERVTIDQLSILGFRAYLEEQTFKLWENGKAKSLAVFAPNATGKSSFVDAFEFYFSEEGTLERLGQRRSGTQAGFEALRHVRAADKESASNVSIAFRGSDGPFDGSREIALSNAPAVRADAANRILADCRLQFIIRGYELRKFVEQETPQDRYKDLCHWFDLAPLLDAQRNLRDLRIQLAKELRTDPATAERLKDLRRITNNLMAVWDESSVANWFNAHCLTPLDPGLSLSILGAEDPVYEILRNRKEEEERRIGADVLSNAIDKISSIYDESTGENRECRTSGSLVEFERAIKDMEKAIEAERQEKERAESAVFKAVWEEAEKIFVDESQDINACPICDTPLDETRAGGRDQIKIFLKGRLATLESYRKALQGLKDRRAHVEKVRSALRADMASLQGHLKAAGYANAHPVLLASETYSLALASWNESLPPLDREPFRLSICAAKSDLKEKLSILNNSQGGYTYNKALETINTLIDLKVQMDRIWVIRKEFQNILQHLSEQETFVAARIRVFLQSVIDDLKDSVNTIYKSVHPHEGEAPKIKLELADDREPKLNMLVDFAPNRKSVVPSGYLSDSQIHTLALSLRLAGIRSSNKSFPVIVLDDIVTSYDADHRKAIAGMLATHFSDFQIIVVTHDERFFCYLQDHLSKQDWKFKRIVNVDPEFGPRFHDHKVTDELIRDRWNRGQSAANEIRQAEEEWLLEKAREFGVSVRIRDVHQPYSYGCGELSISIASFLKDTKVIQPTVSGHANPFLNSLLKGDVENFGSHFQDNPYAWPSIGDEKKRWQEFKKFSDLFVCSACRCKKFKRPKIGVKRALCDKCETPLSLNPTALQTVA